MVLLLPKGVKDEMCLAPLLWELNKYGPRSGNTVSVWNAHRAEHGRCSLWLAFCQVNAKL